MRLWSYQSPEFSLVEGRVEPEKSESVRKYRRAYEGLWAKVGTDQLVWCCTSSDDWQPEPGCCEWILEVPERCIFRIVDEMLWAGIRGETCWPASVRSRLQDEAYAKYADPDRADEWVGEQIALLVNPLGDPWDSLFLSDPRDPRASVVLLHPVERDWVKSMRKIDERNGSG